MPQPFRSEPAVFLSPERVQQDLAQAWRWLWRNPGFAFAAITTLAVGIGATTVMLSVVDAVVLRPLPYAEPQRLVSVAMLARRVEARPSSLGYANFAAWREARGLQSAAAYDGMTVVVEDGTNAAQRATVVFASPSLFNVLGVAPQVGRSFTLADAEQRNAVVVISHRLWQQSFAGSPAVLGKILIVNGRAMEVVGVMPENFFFPNRSDDLWAPETLMPGWEQKRTSFGADSWRVIARLAPGASRASLNDELAAIAAGLERARPENRDYGVAVQPWSERVVGPALRLALLSLGGAVLGVLFVACSNVANLLLARGLVRARELAVRAALGATHGRLLVQLLGEIVLLGIGGALFGAGFAAAGIAALAAWGPAEIPRLDELVFSGRAWGGASVLGIACAVAFGLWPARRATRLSDGEMLRGAGRGLAGTPGARRLRASLIVGQFAAAVMLLVTAGLMTRSLAALLRIERGLEPGDAWVAGLVYPRHREEKLVSAFVSRLVEEVASRPGVDAVGVAEEVLLGDVNERAIAVEGGAANGATLRLPLNVDAVAGEYFRLAGIRLVRGRLFDQRDDAAARPVALINETLARRVWGEMDPLGRRFRAGDDDAAPWLEVVGVVTDARRQSPERPPIAEIYQPYTQRPSRPMKLVVSSRLDPAVLAPMLRQAIAGIDPAVPVAEVTRLHALIDASFAPRQFQVGMVGVCALLAVAFAGVGIFGLINYSVSQRTHEFGVRVALGATPVQIVRLVVGEGLRLAALGLALGLAGAAVLARWLEAALFGVTAGDALTFGGAIAVLGAIALLACYLPARLAARVSAAAALRGE